MNRKNENKVIRMCTWAVLIALVGWIGIGCEPDTTCRQDLDVLCYITLKDEGNKVINTQNVILPISDTICAVGIVKDSTLNATLFITYKNDTNFINMACGCMVVHTLDSVWTNTPTLKAEIINASVPDGDKKNIELKINNQEF